MNSLKQISGVHPKDALEKVLQSASAKFVESVDVVVKLNMGARKSNEHVRGVVCLPKGLGRNVRVAVFAKDKTVCGDESVDFFGDVDSITEVLNGNVKLDFEWCITTPDFMTHLSGLAKILGPKGLMPNPKYGTITSNVVSAVKSIKSGQIRFASDRNGCVHVKIGNVGFTLENILENYNAFIDALKKLKPSTVKGGYFKSIFVSSTMGKSFKVADDVV